MQPHQKRPQGAGFGNELKEKNEMIRPALLLCLGLLACSPRDAEPIPAVAKQEAALVTAFATGSLIIPMDNTSQNNGTFRAFGLVDRLLRANVPVHRVALTGKAAGAIDFSATVNHLETGAVLGSVSYRAGPIVVAAADVTAAVLTLVNTYLAADTVTNVHIATAPFNADVQRTLVAAPRIAVLRDGNETIAFTYLNAANIQDSQGNAWSITSPGALTLAAAAGANGGAFDGALFSGGQPAFDQLTSMHYTVPADDEVVREVRGWLSLGPTTHAYMQCDAVEAFETNVNGRFLSDAGMVDDGATANPDRLRVPDSLFAQFDGNLTVDTGSVDSIGLLPGSGLYANSSVLMDLNGATLGTRMIWLTGHVDGALTKGKVSYLAGHNYSTTVPISTNPQSNGTRLFLNGLYETPGLFLTDQPAVTVSKSAPATTSAVNFTFTLSYANAGPGAAFSASLVDVLPAGTTFVSATGGGVNAAGTVTWPLGTLAAGASGSVTVTVTAPEGTYANTASLSYTVGMTQKILLTNVTSTIVDRTAPNTTLTSTPPAASSSPGAAFTFTGTEPGTFQCSLDGAAFAPCTTPAALAGLADGSHTFLVRAVDTAGNPDPSPASFTWTVDTTAPNTTLTSTPPLLSTSSGATFTFTSTEAGTFQCSLDGAAFAACTTPAALAGLADGSHTFQVRAIDTVGNLDATPASFTWTIDTVVPDTTLTSTPPALTASSSASFTFTSTEAGTFECSLDGALFAACTTPVALAGLVDGSHTFQVRARDTAGNVDATPASFTWTIDTTAPNTTLTSTPPALSTSSSATFTFTSTEAGTFECSLDGAAFAGCTTPVSLSGLADGSHTFQVRARDAIGNVDATPASFTWTIDATAPNTTLTSTPPALSTSSSASFTFTATEAGTFECSLDGAAFAACTTPGNLVGLADGSHTFQVRARDTAGNLDATPASFTWTVDTTAPNTTLTSTPPALSSSSSAAFSFTSTEAGTFECSLDGAAFAACTTPASLSGLADGSHTFQVRGRDTAGNVDATPASFTWTVDATAPNTTFTSTPPALSTSSSASFTFTSTEAGTFECSLDGAAFAACTTPVSLSGLAEGSHTFQARALDTAGNLDATPASFTWTVDTTAPGTTLTSTPPALGNSASASFAFTSTEAGTFECSLDGAAFAPCTTPAALTGLADGSHTFQVRARDTAGNVDATPASFTWVVDTAAPDTSITSAPPALDPSTSASFTFTSTEFGGSFQCSLDGAAFTACPSPLSLTSLAEGSHTLLVQAVDAAGNVDPTPSSHTWTVDSGAPDTTIVSGPNGSVSSTTATFVVTSEAGATFECALDGAAFTACPAMSTYPGLSEGSHTLLIRARDTTGNLDPTPASRTWTVDTSVPDTTITSGPTGTVSSSTAVFTFTSDESPVSFECNLDGAGFAACAASPTFTALADGSHTLLVRALDAAGNADATPASRTWTVDTALPDTTLSGAPTGTTNVSTASLTFTSNEPGATFECSLDGATFAACTTPLSLTALADGPHTFSVRAVDAAGNADPTPATASWTVDALVPDTTITSGPAANVATGDATLAFTSTKAGSTFECSLDGAPFAACTTPAALTALADGSHTFSVRAVDTVGNVDPTPATRTWNVDTQAPDTSITQQPAALTNGTTGTFQFTSPEAGATFECSLDGAAWTACTAPFTTGTLTDGVHVLLVRALDAAGNFDATPARATWEVDTLAPAAPLITEPVADATTGALPRFGGLAEVGSTVTVTINGMTVCTAVVDAAGRWTCNATTALAAGAQTATATATDPAGNTSVPSLPRGFTVDSAKPDTVILTGPAALTNVARADFTVASDASGATFECSLDGAAFAACSASPSFTGLADGAHQLAVRAVSGGMTDPTPATRAWTLDTTAPAAPVITSPTANGTTSGTPTFTGTAEPGSTVVVSLDGQPACTAVADGAGNFSCAAPSALPPGPHTVTAVATDPAGNPSPPSTGVPFTVGSTTLDTAIIAGPSGTVRATTAGFAFTSTVIGATFECSLDGAPFSACPTPATFTGLAAGSHTLEVRAVDGASTDPTPASRTWIVDTSAPSAPVVVTPADQATIRVRTPRYSGTAEPGSTVLVSVDDREACRAIADSSGAWACTASDDLADGAHRVAAVALDAAGNASAPSMTNRFVVDIPAVVVTITSPASGTLTNDGTPAISGTTNPGATVSVFIDGVLLGTVVADAAGVWTLTPAVAIADGTHALTATADLDGLMSPASEPVTVIIDTRAPVVTLTLEQENTETVPVVTFAADEAPVTFTCSLDGAAFTPCASPLDVTAAGDGNHTLVVRATDAAGNTGEATRSFQVTAPIVARPAIGVRGGGCGCGVTDGAGGLFAALALLMFLGARRSRRGLRRLTGLPLLAVALVTAQAASAQVVGFDAERLDLNPGASASLVTGTGDVMRKGAWRASLMVHYEHDPIVLYRLDTNERLGSVIGGRVTTHLVGAWAPLDWLEVGLQLPIVLWQGGDDLSAWDVAAPATTSLGTPWLTGRFAFLRERAGAPLDLALQLGLGLPFGNAPAFTNATPVAFAPRVGAGKSLLAWLRLGAEVGLMVRGTPAGSTQGGTASAFTFGLSATTKGHALRGEVTLRAAVALDAPSAGGDLLFGGRYQVHRWIEVFALGGPGLGTLPGNPAFRVFAGVTVQPPAEEPVAVPVQRCDDSVSLEVLRTACATLDADRDGIKNGEDVCPRVPGVVAAKGCPLPDTDADGLTDDVDACPKEAGPRERKGCPIKDQDKDGVEDADDACVTEAGPVERKGCPVRDADLDGVEDPVDECPAEAGPVERKGCPIRDQDADTVEDALDNCPTVAGVPENAGCPAKVKQLVIITKDKLVIQEAVYFATGKAVVLARSNKLLDNVAEVLLAHPEVALIRVEGHTDSVGVRAKNVALSQARADAVKAALVKRKVPAARLHAVGFGPDQPKDTNDTPAGRELNRRVEFNFETAPK
ncbi:MAG: Ig-like domain-containing protein [Archangium sp.]|nr:Ig-like domain-containing protein [Archangium sp.]